MYISGIIFVIGSVVLLAFIDLVLNPDYKYRCPRCKRGTNELQWQPFLGGDVCNICVEMNKDEINEHYKQLNRLSEEIDKYKDIVNDGRYPIEVRRRYRETMEDLENTRLNIMSRKI